MHTPLKSYHQSYHESGSYSKSDNRGLFKLNNKELTPDDGIGRVFIDEYICISNSENDL